MNHRFDVKLPSWTSILIILFFVFAISLNGVTRYTIRRDELTTLGHIGALERDPEGVPISYTIESLSIYSPEHAPIFYILANIWGNSFAFNYFVLRMLSVWFGIIATAGTYWLGRKIVSHETGLFAATFLGSNVVFYGLVHEMREWSMVLMFAVLVWVIYWHLVHKKRPPGVFEYGALFVVTLIGIYINYMIFFMLIALGLYHLLVVPRDKRWWRITASVVAAGVLYLPWLPVFFDGLSNTQERMIDDIPDLLDNFELIPTMMTYWGNGYPVLFFVLVGLGLYASYKDWKTGRDLVFFVVMILGFMLIANGVFVFVRRIRYVVLWIVPFSLLVGYGLAMLNQRKRLRYGALLIVGLWLVGGYLFTYTDDFNDHMAKDRVIQYPEYSKLLPILREHASKNDLFIQVNYEFSNIRESKQDLRSISSYYMNDLKLKLVNFPLYAQWEFSGIDATPVEYATGLIPQYDEFWFSYLHTRVTDEMREFRSTVEENYTVCESYVFGERSVLDRYVLTEKYAELCEETL